MLYKTGVGYSSINTARSALSSFLTLGKSVSVGQLPLVKGYYVMFVLFALLSELTKLPILMIKFSKTKYLQVTMFSNNSEQD
jgi:hypothetical protein